MTTQRIIVGAHYGLRDWLAQRISALVLIGYTIVLIVALLAGPDLNYSTWAGLFAGVWMKVATLLALLALIYHAWIGVRDIYMDYVGSTAVRLTLEVATILVLLGYACWTVIILWRV
jgi:succinate dehydrogenase / fumarate reductase, membrane anchor subunit